MFTKLMLSLSFCFALTAANAEVRPFIVGGSDAAAGEFPFIVSLQTSASHFCGGSLIKKNWVLTAGHCVEGGYLKKIYLGLLDQNDRTHAEVRSPKRVIRHPQYNNNTTDFDFALIELDRDSTYSPIELNTEEITVPTDATAPQIMSLVAGWGETSQLFTPMNSADRLQKVEVPLVTKDACDQAYSGMITDRMICAGLSDGGKDSCYGDSGGPLTMVDAATGVRKLIGVVSWGEGCAQPNKFGVYAKVNSVTEWINTTTN